MNRAELKIGDECWYWNPDRNMKPEKTTMFAGTTEAIRSRIYPDAQSLNAAIAQFAESERERILSMCIMDVFWEEYSPGGYWLAEQFDKDEKHTVSLATVYPDSDGWSIEWLILGHKDTCHPTLSEAKEAVEEAVREARK